MVATSVTCIFSPYHVGLRDHRVGDGPNRLREIGVEAELKKLGIKIRWHEISRVDDFEGEIGRSFEVLRRTSEAVSQAVAKQSFPLVLSGNCMASAGIACGLRIDDLGFIYFDAHDDMETPAWNTNGYLDAMGLSMLAGKSWEKLASTIPGYKPFRYERFLYCGLRDVSDESRQTVAESGADVIWGDANVKVNFASKLQEQLKARNYSPALVHLDLDVLDETVGKVNGFESAGGLTEIDLVESMALVPLNATPKSLTVCSFNPNLGDGDKIAKIGVRAIVAFMTSLLESGVLKTDNST
jgi:arginase